MNAGEKKFRLDWPVLPDDDLLLCFGSLLGRCRHTVFAIDTPDADADYSYGYVSLFDRARPFFLSLSLDSFFCMP